MQKIERATGLKADAKNNEYDLDYCGCLGCCDFGPNLLVNNNIVLGVDKNSVMEEIAKAAETETPTSEEKMAGIEKVLNDLI